jgi:hypothetical protein
MHKEYYLGITQGNKIVQTESLNDYLIRNDIIHIFKASYDKTTPKNFFYKIMYLKDKLPQETPVLMELKGIKTTYNYGEIWAEFFKTANGKCLQFMITDLVGIEKRVNFHNYPKITSGLESYLIYLDHLLRLGTHQAILEVKDLEFRIEKLKR